MSLGAAIAAPRRVDKRLSNNRPRLVPDRLFPCETRLEGIYL
jgi:hypothetical protein